MSNFLSGDSKVNANKRLKCITPSDLKYICRGQPLYIYQIKQYLTC